jgi:hypothetical protein
MLSTGFVIIDSCFTNGYTKALNVQFNRIDVD